MAARLRVQALAVWLADDRLEVAVAHVDHLCR
jgi:hypothetical protein